MPFGLHPAYLIILLAIVLIIFGPGKLPELGGAVGRGIREFRKHSNEITEEVRSSMHEKDTPGTATSASENKAEPEKASSVSENKAEPEKKS
jgi:sec-independent protein translocase protein TatA